MLFLERLIGDHIGELSGAEFKIAAYFYLRFELQPAEVRTKMKPLAEALDLSVRHTGSALKTLHRKGIFCDSLWSP